MGIINDRSTTSIAIRTNGGEKEDGRTDRPGGTPPGSVRSPPFSSRTYMYVTHMVDTDTGKFSEYLT